MGDIMEEVAQWRFYTAYEQCLDYKALAAYDKRGGGGALFDLEDIVDVLEEEGYEGMTLFIVVFAIVIISNATAPLKVLI